MDRVAQERSTSNKNYPDIRHDYKCSGMRREILIDTEKLTKIFWNDLNFLLIFLYLGLENFCLSFFFFRNIKILTRNVQKYSETIIYVYLHSKSRKKQEMPKNS